MWCTRWFLPLLLLPLPTAPPYFLLLFLITLALHARPCFYCIILLAALFLSSCYWQSFSLDAHLSVPWADNITTFSEALNATLPSHLSALEYAPPIVRVADRCWCDFASGLFDPYDVQQWERDSIQRAVDQIEKQWKQTLEPEDDASENATVAAEPSDLEPQPPPITPTGRSSAHNGTLFSILRSLFGKQSNKTKPPPIATPVDIDTPKTLPTSPVDELLIQAKPPQAYGQLDMRPFGFELIFDFRWSRRS